ncbi:septum site-determining protein MinC [Clostridium sediminicola]|uniref:septum site-determining protein MinC n=1 Tax=Clostridium sediminicola TaxID=3114879 RepID=UPI0031F24C24
MGSDGLIIKGNKDGLNAVIDMNKYRDFQDMLETLTLKLSNGKKFYKGSTLKITADLKQLNERNIINLKKVLFEEFLIKDCILEDKKEKSKRSFSGVYEGRTKFIRKSVRSGQIIQYNGNLVIVGDVNPGAEVYAGGNIMVFGALKGNVHAGFNGNSKAIVVAFSLQPQILDIAGKLTIAPDGEKPGYPEIAKIKGDTIVVEPYLLDKYI